VNLQFWEYFGEFFSIFTTEGTSRKAQLNGVGYIELFEPRSAILMLQSQSTTFTWSSPNKNAKVRNFETIRNI
jgi:hypothetical protein